MSSQEDLKKIMLPTTEAIDATAELSAKLEEAEALLVAHRNRRVVTHNKSYFRFQIQYCSLLIAHRNCRAMACMIHSL